MCNLPHMCYDTYVGVSLKTTTYVSDCRVCVAARFARARLSRLCQTTTYVSSDHVGAKRLQPSKQIRGSFSDTYVVVFLRPFWCATYYLLPTTYYILHTTYYILHTAYYIHHATYYILHTTYHMLHSTNYIRHITHCMLHTT